MTALHAAGHDAELEDPPGWPRRSPDLAEYGRELGTGLADADRRVDLLVGLSVGTQAAAVAAATAGPDVIGHLLLVSPTVPPEIRTPPRLMRQFLAGENHPDSPSWRSHMPDWRRAGIPNLVRGFRSALQVRLEELLPAVTVPVTLVHAGADHLSSHDFAARLATEAGAQLVLMPDAPHSWPTADNDRFVALVDRLLSGQPA